MSIKTAGVPACYRLAYQQSHEILISSTKRTKTGFRGICFVKSLNSMALLIQGHFKKIVENRSFQATGCEILRLLTIIKRVSSSHKPIFAN